MLHASFHGAPQQRNQAPWGSHGDIWGDAIGNGAAVRLRYDDWWVPQPQSPEDVMHFEHIQQLWNYHSEDGTRSFPDDSLTTWQGADGGLPSPVEMPWTGSLSDGVSILKLAENFDTSPVDSYDLESEAPSENKSGKSAHDSETVAKEAMTNSLSSLPLPVRVPIHPERMVLKDPSFSGRQDPADAPQQGTEAHHGLLPPPGLTLARAASLSTDIVKDAPVVSVTSMTQATSRLDPPQVPFKAKAAAPTPSGDTHPGVSVGSAIVGGAACTRVDWSIEDFRGKLFACMGRPLVSPPFAVQGLPNLRLMVFPDAREAVKNARSRDRKGLYETMVRKGPLHGALKLKADCLEPGRDASVVRLNLLVGAVRRGPFTFDFTKRAVADCDDFGTDWLKQIDKATGNLRVCAEILTIGSSGEGPPTEPVRLCDGPIDLGMFEDREADGQPWNAYGRRAAKSQQRLRAH